MLLERLAATNPPPAAEIHLPAAAALLPLLLLLQGNTKNALPLLPPLDLHHLKTRYLVLIPPSYIPQAQTAAQVQVALAAAQEEACSKPAAAAADPAGAAEEQQQTEQKALAYTDLPVLPAAVAVAEAAAAAAAGRKEPLAARAAVAHAFAPDT